MLKKTVNSLQSKMNVLGKRQPKPVSRRRFKEL
jgi:hypothetical protein